MKGDVGIVRFVCAASDHLHQNRKLSDHLTIHDGQWAYCAHNVPVEGHE